LASWQWLLNKYLGEVPRIGATIPQEVPKRFCEFGLTSTKEILMNKKLIALAVAGVCAAPTVMAQSANPITLYGALRMDVEYVEADGRNSSATNAATSGVDGRFRVVDHPSLLGVRGKEDLGGGLKAWFQLETGFDSTQPSGTFANRNTAVGLEGNWGTFLAGRWDMPMKMDIGKTDLWGDINRADYTAATMNQGNFSSRLANVLQYWSPNWSGFQVKLAWVPDEAANATGSIAPEAFGASGSWSKGGIYLAAAWEKKENYRGTTAITTPGYEEEGWTIGGTWTIGNHKLAAHYGEYEVPNDTTTANARVFTDKSYYVGYQYTMGKHDFLASYQNSDNGKTLGECDVLGVGWRYNFSRRTKTVLGYSEINNDANATCNLGSGGSLGGVGESPKGFGLSILHYF